MSVFGYGAATLSNDSSVMNITNEPSNLVKLITDSKTSNLKRLEGEKEREREASSSTWFKSLKFCIIMIHDEVTTC